MFHRFLIFQKKSFLSTSTSKNHGFLENILPSILEKSVRQTKERAWSKTLKFQIALHSVKTEKSQHRPTFSWNTPIGFILYYKEKKERTAKYLLLAHISRIARRLHYYKSTNTPVDCLNMHVCACVNNVFFLLFLHEKLNGSETNVFLSDCDFINDFLYHACKSSNKMTFVLEFN